MLTVNRKVRSLLLLVLLCMLVSGCQDVDSLEWERYNNDYYAFKYPSGWKLNENKEQGYSVLVSPSENSKAEIRFFINRVLTLPPDYSEKDFYENVRQNKMVNGELVSQKKTTFKGASAYKRTFISTFKGKKTKITRIHSYLNNSIVSIGYMGRAAKEYDHISKLAKEVMESLTIKENLLHICANGSSKKIKQTIANKMDVNKRFTQGFTPLIWAAAYNQDPKAITTLIDLGAKVNLYAGDEEKTALDFAIENNQNKEVIKTLINQGADVNYQNRFGWTPLMRAIREDRSLDLIKYLVNQGAKINIRHNTGGSPLTEAIARGDLEVIKFLIDSGADVNAQNQDGKTPLIFAVHHSKNQKIINLLISQGADASIKDAQGNKALDYINKNDALQKTEVKLTLIKETIREDEKSFTVLQKYIKATVGHYQLKSKLFQEKREELGSEFEAKVCQAVKGDIKSCRFFGSFLLAPDYLHGNQPRPELALKIFDIGLNVTPTSDNMRAARLSLMVTAAIANKKYDNKEKAVSLKRKVENLLAEKPMFSGAFPALTKEDRAVYESIKIKTD